MFQFRFALKFLNLRKTLKDPTAILAIGGLVLGVGSLIVSMAVFSGFETALKKAIIDVVGHVTVTRRGTQLNLSPEDLKKMAKEIPEIVALSPYVSLEALATRKGHIAGIRVEGLDPTSYQKVLHVHQRIIAGQFVLEPLPNEESPILIGKGLANTLEAQVGDSIKIILPRPSLSNSKKFLPRVGKFKVAGILDLGKYDFNERLAVMSLSKAQSMAQIGDAILGVRIRLKSSELAPSVAHKILKYLGGYPYWTRTWLEINQNLLEATKLEKLAIFLVVLIMVIAACFNVASTLYVRVINRFSEISIIKSMGAKNSFVLKIFALQGLMLGAIGACGGVGLGVLLAKAFKWFEQRWGLMPADIYKIEVFKAELRLTDLCAVFVATFLICFLSTLLPAVRGSRLNPCEGLRYE